MGGCCECAWLDGGFWGTYFERVFIQQVETFYDGMVQRVLQAFGDLEQEAASIGQADYERLCDLLAETDYRDMEDPADAAEEVALEHYEVLSSVRQAMLNLAVVALHHLVEQQLLLFHRSQVLRPTEEDDPSKISFGELRKRLRSGGVDMEALPAWHKLDEFRTVANAVKHAEGTAVERLRAVRPDLFVPRVRVHAKSFFDHLEPPASVYLPLAGQDIFLTVEDLGAYKTAIVEFWRQFSALIGSYTDTKVKPGGSKRRSM